MKSAAIFWGLSVNVKPFSITDRRYHMYSNILIGHQVTKVLYFVKTSLYEHNYYI